MRAIFGMAALAGLFMAVCPAAAQTRWPNGAKAAVVLTYDDALASQLDHVVPELDAAGLKGTFFLANVHAEHVERWRAVAKQGHELANHTIFHPCTKASFPADPRYVSEAYTSASMIREIAQQEVLLRSLDGKQRHGFATPCGQSLAGGQDYLEDLRKAGIVTYVRGVVDTPADARANVAQADPMHIPSRGFGEGATAAKMIAYVREAEQGGGWAVFLFHGVGGDYLTVPDAEHRAFVRWLAEHRKDVWVTTLQGALDWAKAHP
ncbi:polysaccharide deacetylase family protein [Sphingomonas sp. TDK1]|uniref:polysaccharide deacetylase family protein n=1 Tax=Sphingomonas sp. TDK1 TaxID=453247 RepID=UPI0007D9610C|nr:polysaccharide deacetylase family protein [Sphingomonas sp. TDK1]OAN57082.1 polysaccharide deacetylase [Sphingomonas sp. TDK1]